jgi:hypothetical protein
MLRPKGSARSSAPTGEALAAVWKGRPASQAAAGDVQLTHALIGDAIGQVAGGPMAIAVVTVNGASAIAASSRGECELATAPPGVEHVA